MTGDPSTLSSLLASAEFWSAIAGAVVGTIGAGLISASMAAVATRDRRKMEAEARNNRERAIATRLTLKMKLLVDDAYSTLLGLKRQLGEEWGLRGPTLAARLLPMAAADAYRVHFDQEELAFLHGAHHADLLNNLIVYDQRHSVLSDVMKLYAERRRELAPFAAQARGTAVSYTPSPETAAQFNILVQELGDLADGIVDGAIEQYRTGISNMHALGAAMRRHFSDDAFPSGEIDSEAIDDIMRAEVEAAAVAHQKSAPLP